MKKHIVILAAVLSASLAGCGSFLDEQPVSEVPAGNMWKTSRDAKAGVNQIYGFFRTAMRENYFYWGEFRSDNLAPGASSAADQQRVIDNQLTTDHRCTRWTDLYKVINQANLCIKYIPGIDTPSVAERDDLLGQAYGMRALAYFYAVRVWGDVPLFVEPNEAYSDAIYRERTDRDYILREIILEDAKKAEGLLDRTKNKERKRISVYGAWAIMADAYMWLGEYSLADQTIQKMKNDASFMAFEPSIDTWKKMFTEELNGKASDNTPENDDYSTKEFIFVIHFNMDEVGTNGFSYMYQWFTGSGNRAGVVSETLRNKFEQDRDLRFPLVAKEYQAGWEMRKYIAGDISSTLNKTCQVAYPVYRYSDMLLLQAEALARLSKWEEALDLVKLVRTRAGLDTPQADSFATEDELVDFILDERQRELLGEGRRWFDLVRTGRWKTVMGPINGCSTEGNELFPVHYSHLDQNKALKQNAYYAQTQE